MNSSFDFDSRLSSWLDEQAVPRAPDALLAQVVERASHTRRRPAWATLERWISMETRARIGAVPKTALVLTILAALLALFSAIAVGQQPSPRLPAPMGVARNGLIAFDDGGDIFVVEPDGTDRKALTSGPAIDTAPEWSQDGTRIAYFSQQQADGPASIKVMDADGLHATTLVEGVTLPEVSWHVSWSHDGRTLAYAERTIQGLSAVDRIMVVPVAGGDPVAVATPGQAPTWSPDDRMIAYQSGGLGTDAKVVPQGLSVVASDGTGQRVIDGAATMNPWAYAYPQWSPDGKRLAYHAGLPNNPSAIYVAAVDGTGIHAISDTTHNPSWPAWSPDGSRIGFIGWTVASGPYQIFVVDPDGSHPSEVNHPPLACDCAFHWSPDGTMVIAWLDGPIVDGAPASESLMIADTTASRPVQTIGLTSLIGSDMSWQRLAR